MPSMGLITCLFVNNSQETTVIWTFVEPTTSIILSNGEVICSLITFDNDDSHSSKCLLPMNCSYPVCSLFFNYLHLRPFRYYYCHRIDDNKTSDINSAEKSSAFVVYRFNYWFQLQYPVMCVSLRPCAFCTLFICNLSWFPE